MSQNLWDRILGGGRTLEVMRLAQEIAVAASPTIREAVLAGALPMARSEARGYVRAKCTPTLRVRVAAAADNASLYNEARELLAAETADRTMRLVLDDVVRVRSRQVAQRRAA